MTGAGEFDLIARHFAPLSAAAPLAFGLTDDAAMIRPRKGRSLVVTADAIVAGCVILRGCAAQVPASPARWRMPAARR